MAGFQEGMARKKATALVGIRFIGRTGRPRSQGHANVESVEMGAAGFSGDEAAAEPGPAIAGLFPPLVGLRGGMWIFAVVYLAAAMIGFTLKNRLPPYKFITGSR